MSKSSDGKTDYCKVDCWDQVDSFVNSPRPTQMYRPDASVKMQEVLQSSKLLVELIDSLKVGELRDLTEDVLEVKEALKSFIENSRGVKSREVW